MAKPADRMQDILQQWSQRGDVSARESIPEPSARAQAVGRQERCTSCGNLISVLYVEGARDPEAPTQCFVCIRAKRAAGSVRALQRPQRTADWRDEL